MATFASASACLFHPHVPFDQPAHLTFGVAALDHACDEIVVLLFGLAILLRSERDHRKQIFDLGEYPLLDPLADLFVRCPRWILAAVLRPRPQREFDHLVAEILWIGDPGRLLDL